MAAPIAVTFVLAAVAVATLPWSVDAASKSAGDTSWIQAYNAAYVRAKYAGNVSAAFAVVDPTLLSSLPSIADCPAVPSTFPFPARHRGQRLDQILRSGTVKVAQQDLGPFLQPFSAAFRQVTTAVVQKVGAAYKVKLSATFMPYPTADAAVQAVIDGDADVTDPFYRQWTLIGQVGSQVQKSVLATPACTTWATFMSISWNSTRTNWTSLSDLAAAGSAVVIPLYSSVLPFIAEARNVLPTAVLLERPVQNFETDLTALRSVLTEFAAGATTALLAAKSDLQVALQRANLSATFDLRDVTDTRTNIVLPVGAWLPRAGAKRK